MLHSFAGGTDGAYPAAGLVFDKKGNLYGTTKEGGGHNGTVFKLTPSGKETVLYNFSGNSDGYYPEAGLILDAKGNFYGTTTLGGGYFGGTVFKVTPSGKEAVLYRFCSQNNCTDGSTPGGLVFDANGNLYGATNSGGGTNNGTVFKLTPSRKETVLYSFTGGTDGAFPSGLVLDEKGSLYGTTAQAGANRGGTVFKVAPSTRKETVLYSFTGADGANPRAGVAFDKQGNLYGTTYYGGTNNNGIVFKLVP